MELNLKEEILIVDDELKNICRQKAELQKINTFHEFILKMQKANSTLTYEFLGSLIENVLGKVNLFIYSSNYVYQTNSLFDNLTQSQKSLIDSILKEKSSKIYIMNSVVFMNLNDSTVGVSTSYGSVVPPPKDIVKTA